MTFPADADGRVQEDGVDALGVHHAEPRGRIVGARRAPFRVGDLSPGQEAGRVHLDPAQGSELTAQRLERLAVDQEDLVPVLVARDADRPIAI